jgi:tRNA-uridine 2-sulfurtransferase
MGIPHLTVDLSGAFFGEVVQHFIDEYEAARTPNPCVRCNSSLRFSELAALADRLGLAWIATGHYARVLEGEGRLRRGRDARKDQSYVLAQVDPFLISRTLLPLGELTKDVTRALAREAGLDVHDRAESQEICFIPDDDYRRFLRERLGDRPGRLVTEGGLVVGEHRGHYNFTVGQRKGLGVSGPQPYYVLALADRDVVVGPAEAADVRRIWVEGVIWHSPVRPDRGAAQLRSTGRAVGAWARMETHDRLLLVLDEAERGVAPGQTAVLYQDDLVVAAGVVSRTDAGAGGGA